jgi:hypothetical protein
LTQISRSGRVGAFMMLRSAASDTASQAPFHPTPKGQQRIAATFEQTIRGSE